MCQARVCGTLAGSAVCVLQGCRGTLHFDILCVFVVVSICLFFCVLVVALCFVFCCFFKGCFRSVFLDFIYIVSI